MDLEAQAKLENDLTELVDQLDYLRSLHPNDDLIEDSWNKAREILEEIS